MYIITTLTAEGQVINVNKIVLAFEIQITQIFDASWSKYRLEGQISLGWKCSEIHFEVVHMKNKGHFMIVTHS